MDKYPDLLKMMNNLIINLDINQNHHCKEEDEAEMRILAAKRQTLSTLGQLIDIIVR